MENNALLNTSRLAKQVAGGGAPLPTEAMRTYEAPRRIATVNKGDLQGFFRTQNVTTGFQQERQRAVRGANPPKSGHEFCPDAMTKQFVDTRTVNYSTIESSIWDAQPQAEVALDQGGDSEFWGSHSWTLQKP